jgi:hypothetical protein
MGTPEQELEPKYFIEGETHARGGKNQEFCFAESMQPAAA